MVAVSCLPCSYAKAWSPSDCVAPLSAWYKADSINVVDGGSVSAWSDSSGNSNTASQGDGTKQPTLQTNELNGLSVVRFDGSNDIVTDDGIAALNVGTGDIWLACVFKSTDDSGAQNFFEKGPTTFGLRCLSNGKLEMTLGSAANTPIQNSGSWSRRAYVVVTASRVSGTCNGFVDGTASSTTGTTNTTSIDNSDAFDIGARAANGAGAMTGDIVEILVGGGTITEKELTTVAGYLANKYGLDGNLPVTHTYKNGEPWGLGKS